MQNVCGIVLAAGDGTRMKSAHSKVLCEVLFKPMLTWVLESANAAGLEKLCVVVSDQAEDVRTIIPTNYQTAVQALRLGTGHAVKMAKSFLVENRGADVLILYGDAPFVDTDTIKASHEAHIQAKNAVTVVSAQLANPFGYGRIYRENGAFSRIVEHADASEEIGKIREINSGIYWFQVDFLLETLHLLKNDNAKQEYYLTDTIEIAKKQGKTVDIYQALSPEIVMGANDRASLQVLNGIARDKVLAKLLQNGVDIPLADGIIISNDAQIGRDTLILPNTIIKGKCTIGAGCILGQGSTIEHSILGDNVEFLSSHVQDSTIESDAKIGPFARIRPNSHIKQGAKIGNFVEIKNSVIGKKTSVAHLTYIGDSDVGDNTNFGCGVVTANYDGAKKHRTIIGNSVFLGCNTNLIPPVTVGDGAITAAGTTITEDVPADALAIGRAPQVNKENWAVTKGKYKKL